MDNRLRVFSQTRNGIPGSITGKKFFYPDKTLLSGHYNLGINFQFQKTIILGKKIIGTLLSNYHIQYMVF